MSREAAFLANNWILLFSAFFVLFATMFPTLSEAVTGERLTVGPPFFNKWMLPIGLVLLLLTGVGPLLAWRKSTLHQPPRLSSCSRSRSASSSAGSLVALGVRVWTSGICFALCAFVIGTIAQEFWRGARVRQGATGTDIFTALVGLVGRNKRRYGGYIVHVGIVLIFLGFAGEGFKQDEQVLLKPGQQVQVGDFTVRLDALKVTDDGQKQMITGHMTVFRDGKEIAKMYPAKWFFRKHEDEPTTEVAIRRSFAEDLYLVLPAFDLQAQSASMEIIVNPLVNWIWLGFGVLALGTGIALLPETAFAFALREGAGQRGDDVAAPAVARCCGPRRVIAQRRPDACGAPTQRSALQRQLESEIMCMCGVPRADGQLPDAPELRALRRSRAARLDGVPRGREGLTTSVLAAFVAGVRRPGRPGRADRRGFNRLAWLFPYLVAAAALVGIVVTARRWSRRRRLPSPATRALDPALNARLDDELRNLD